MQETFICFIFWFQQIINNICEEISKRTNQVQYHKLISELEIAYETVGFNFTSYCTNPKDMQNARTEILKCWWDNQESSEEAYVLMGDTLIRAGLKLIAREVLNYPAVMKTSDSPSAIYKNCISSCNPARSEAENMVTRF